MKRGKNAQFYLIAAVIIVAVFMSVAGAKNYLVRKKPIEKFYDLGEELNVESSRVIDYGIYKEENVVDTIEGFTDNYFSKYAQEKEKNIELVFVYGNKENTYVAVYKDVTTGNIRISYGGASFVKTGAGKLVAERQELGSVDESIVINILGRDYNFNLKDGENFLFVIAKQTSEGTYVAQEN